MAGFMWGVVNSQWLGVPAAIRSINAKKTPLNTKVIWITTFNKNIFVQAYAINLFE